jgi:hypothetical protein
MTTSIDGPERRIALFQRKEIRRTIHNNEWWFVITDVVVALTDSTDPSQYLKRIRQRDPQLNEVFKGGVQFVPPLALPFTTAGGVQNVLCWNTEGLFRLIQSIPSPKAEPFKRWLARVGYNGGNVLTWPVLESLPAHDGPKIVYGTACRISPARRARENIAFKQIPYGIRTQ